MATKRRSKNSDIIDATVGTALDISGHIYEVPYSVFQKSISTALQLKDAVKKKIGLNPKRNPDPVYVYRFHNDQWNFFCKLDPDNVSEWQQYVRLAQREPHRYRLVRPGMEPNPKRRRNGKRNPADGAEEAYEAFHGRDSGETVVVEKEFHEHEHLAALGYLVDCWFVTPTGFIACIQFPEKERPILSMNEQGTQLYIEGGVQYVDLSQFEMDTKEWVKDRMVLGTFAPPSEELERMQRKTLERGDKYNSWNIAYLTEKKFDDFEPIIYQHDLGEVNEGEPKSHRREAPLLEFEPRNEQLYVTGGQYRIKLPRIGVSPGIEN